jgi:hypothetical protein
MASRDDDDCAPSRIRLPTLGQNGENFVIWKTQLKLQITGMGKARYINGRAIEPVKPTLTDGANDAAKAVHKQALETCHESPGFYFFSRDVSVWIQTRLSGTELS